MLEYPVVLEMSYSSNEWYVLAYNRLSSDLVIIWMMIISWYVLVIISMMII